MSTPLDDLRAAGVNVRLSPAHPFSVLLVSPFTGADKDFLRRTLEEEPSARASIVTALLKEMDAATFDAFLEATVVARADVGAAWSEQPWTNWRSVLEMEFGYRISLAVIDADVRQRDTESYRRQTEKERLLVKLQAAGPKGVLNGELEAGEVGRRYSARLEELRKEGWQIDTQRVDARSFRFILKGRQMFKEEGAA